jgi:hypothetical protein
VWSIGLGFLGGGRFAAKAPILSVGFPWILSSESRLFNGLRGLSQKGFFASLFRVLRRAATGRRDRGHAEAQDCSWVKLNHVSDFLQHAVTLAFPFRIHAKWVKIFRRCDAPRLVAATRIRDGEFHPITK